MLRSMTAFARVSSSRKEGNWVVEIKSVNHRFFEFSVKLPPDFHVYENRIRECIQSGIRRGKVTVGISQNADEACFQQLVLDEDAAKKYLNAFRKLKRRFHLSGDMRFGDVAQLPGLFVSRQTKELASKRWPLLKKAIEKTLVKMVRAKETEGLKIMRDIAARLKAIRRAVGQIEKHAEGRSKQYFEKIQADMRRLLGEAMEDKERLFREAALLAERSDITEELVRITSHLALFHKRLQNREDVGRELDFLCQEMNREINTMSAKAQLFEISREVVFVKGELEKIREQVQNVE